VSDLSAPKVLEDLIQQAERASASDNAFVLSQLRTELKRVDRQQQKQFQSVTP